MPRGGKPMDAPTSARIDHRTRPAQSRESAVVPSRSGRRSACTSASTTVASARTAVSRRRSPADTRRRPGRQRQRLEPRITGRPRQPPTIHQPLAEDSPQALDQGLCASARPPAETDRAPALPESRSAEKDSDHAVPPQGIRQAARIEAIRLCGVARLASSRPDSNHPQVPHAAAHRRRRNATSAYSLRPPSPCADYTAPTTPRDPRPSWGTNFPRAIARDRHRTRLEKARAIEFRCTAQRRAASSRVWCMRRGNHMLPPGPEVFVSITKPQQPGEKRQPCSVCRKCEE